MKKRFAKCIVLLAAAAAIIVLATLAAHEAEAQPPPCTFSMYSPLYIQSGSANCSIPPDSYVINVTGCVRCSGGAVPCGQFTLWYEAWVDMLDGSGFQMIDQKCMYTSATINCATLSDIMACDLATEYDSTWSAYTCYNWKFFAGVLKGDCSVKFSSANIIDVAGPLTYTTGGCILGVNVTGGTWGNGSE